MGNTAHNAKVPIHRVAGGGCFTVNAPRSLDLFKRPMQTTADDAGEDDFQCDAPV